MGRRIVVNKLSLDGNLVGYRFDILEGSNKVVSLDINKNAAKAFLSLVDSSQIIKGYNIKGRIEGSLFVTNDESNVVEVTNKNQAIEVLNKYYYNVHDDAIEDILDIGEDTKEDEARKRVENSIKGDVRVSANEIECEYDYVFKILALINKSSKGIKCDNYVFEHYVEIKFECVFNDLKELFKFVYTLHKNDCMETEPKKDSYWSCNYNLPISFYNGREDVIIEGSFNCKDSTFEEVWAGVIAQIGDLRGFECAGDGSIGDYYIYTDGDDTRVIVEIYIPEEDSY